MADQVCAKQISLRSKRSWMPHTGTRRSSMTAMTEALLVGKEHKHGRRQAGMTLNECSQRSAVY